MSDVVRKQIAATIDRKAAQARKLGRIEAQIRKDLKATADKRQAIEGEVAELEAHLKELGGRIEPEPKPKAAKPAKPAKKTAKK